MAREPFLINPPRRRRKKNPFVAKRKKVGFRATSLGALTPVSRRTSKRRITKKKGGVKMAKVARKPRRKLYGAALLAWKKKRGMVTGTTKRRKKSGKKTTTRRRRRATSGGVRVIVGKRARGHVRTVRVNAPRRRRKYRKNPLMIAGLNPRRRRSSRRRYRRNPALAVAGFDFMRNLPLMFTGAVSAIATVSVPKLVGVQFSNPYMQYGSQLAVVAGGGWVLDRYVGRNHAGVWIMTGSAVIIADLLKKYVLEPYFPTIPLSDYVVEAFPNQIEGRGIAAFPDVSPYGGGISAYPDVESVMY